jgi:hypothetical protein
MLAIPVSLIGTFASVGRRLLHEQSLPLRPCARDRHRRDDAIGRGTLELAEGHPARSRFKAMEEVTPAVIAIAFGLSAVFIPVAFILDHRQFYRQFALTISFSTLLRRLIPHEPRPRRLFLN